ncbi:MAG: DUF6867 family protein [Pseudomonadota bacterium]
MAQVWRLLRPLVLLVALFGALPAAAQDSVVGLWVSDDGAITFHLTIDNTYELSGDLVVEQPLLTGRYVVPEGSGEIIARASERPGAMRFTVVELGQSHLVLTSDEILGGSVTFSQPSAFSVAIDRALSSYALFWLLVMAGGAVLTGQALARTWQPFWKTVPYAALIGLADLCPSLFDARLIHPLDSVVLFAIHAPVLWIVMFVAFFATKASRMVAQYPWLYTRRGMFGWQVKEGQSES